MKKLLAALAALVLSCAALAQWPGYTQKPAYSGTGTVLFGKFYTRTQNSFSPNSLPNLAAWYRFNVGVTIVGSGVDTWADQSGNARDLRQTTDANRPAHVAGVITCDGTTSFLLKNFGATLSQPNTIYILGKWVVWSNRTWFDGGTGGTARHSSFGITSSPTVVMFAGSTVANNSNKVVGTFDATAYVFNGASSLIQVNSTTPTTGNAGAQGLDGFMLCDNFSNSSKGNIAVREIIIYNAAHDQGTRDRVIGYLNSLPGCAVDSDFANVKLLAINNNKADATTAFADQSTSAKAITANGNVQYDTGQAPTALTSSGQFDGAGDYLTVGDSNDWAFAGDLTIEMWLRIAATGGTTSLFAQDSQAANFSPISWVLDNTTGATTLYASTTGSSWDVFNAQATNSGNALSTTTWYHLALVRSGNTWYQFQNGTQVWTASGAVSGALANVARTLGIGNQFQATANGLNGHIGAYRVTAAARYTANFTPPTPPLATNGC